MEEKAFSSIMSNPISVGIIVFGIIAVIGIIAYLIAKGKLNIKSDKLSIESAKQNTKSLLAECRTSCNLMSREFAAKYIEKFPKNEYQILYICELVLNRVEKMLQYNNITTDEDYIKMRFVDIKAIVDTNKVAGGDYTKEFYDELYNSFSNMVKQIVALKKHYKED